MDQARFEELMAQYQTSASAEVPIYDLDAHAGQFSEPIVLLVHGIGGNARHWSDPLSMNVNDTWLFDIGASPPQGSTGLASSPPYKPDGVDSWTKYLKDNNLSYINFSQVKPGNLLEYAVHEVVELLTRLQKVVYEPYEQDVAANGGEVPPLIIVCHSRGGLVTRAALKQLGKAGVPHLTKFITLCTPHRGSYMPKLANDYNGFLHNQISFHSFTEKLPGPLETVFEHTIEAFAEGISNHVREAMLHSFGTLAQSPGFDELIPGSPTLTALAQDEQPIEGVKYYGFGGTQPTFVNLFFVVAGQVVHLLGTASGLLVEMLSKIPGIHDNYGGIGELVGGDSAVSLASSVWPEQFAATHKELHLNHMQALIDGELQNNVLDIINEGKGGSSGGW